ncbi:hypothetical protein GOBAR_AA04541 [Gossypium barbadense]|uniref:Uncharacterized protein n=1 Tax=Gossypium barbadense TaxID=3634 RepID=A0A2P5YKA0_GOSBA|nr:hypothetical protein GOBAR_AA04541 [Gossypium barbadense]
MELCSTFHLQTVMTNYNDPGTLTRLQGGERALASSTPTTSTSYGACRKGTSSTLPISGVEEPTFPSTVSPNLPMRRPTRTFLMMSPYSTRTHRLSHHHPLIQLMRRLHMLTSLSTSPDSSSSVFNDLTTPPHFIASPTSRIIQ